MNADVVVLGAGHNGLVAAALLAKGGRSVIVVERRDVIGGCAAREEVWPGFAVPSGAYDAGLFSDDVATELDLARHGYQAVARDPTHLVIPREGAAFTLSTDVAATAAELGRVHGPDGERWPAFVAWRDDLAAALDPLADELPPELPPSGLGGWLTTARFGARHRAALERLDDLIEVATGSVADVVSRWFEHPSVRAALAFDGLLGAWAGPSTPGTGTLFLHHARRRANGTRGGCVRVRGGTGALVDAIARAASEKGVELRTGSGVAEIVVRDGVASGVVLEDGTEIHAGAVVSCADPQTTLRCLGEAPLPDGDAERIERLDTRSGWTAIDVALEALPRFAKKPHRRPTGAAHHGALVRLVGTLDDLDAAFDDARAGRPSAEPLVECTIPTYDDDSIAPPGKHLLTIAAQWLPPTADDAARDAFADAVLARVAEAAPNVPDETRERRVRGPRELEAALGMSGGHPHHVAMTPAALSAWRPARRWSRHATPIRNLWLCGAGSHPGGGVTGLPGRATARALLARR